MDGNRLAPYLAVFNNREWKFTAVHFLLQVVLAHPPNRFPFFRRAVRERIPVAGYDRQYAVFFKVRTECFISVTKS